jgi:predicted GNAT family acetyltransferase
MTVQHRRSGNKGLFFVEYENHVAAEMVYSMSGDTKMIIEHTEVSDELRGKNIGYELVHAAVEYARHHGLKIIPICSFARSIFDKKPDFRDVLA